MCNSQTEDKKKTNPYPLNLKKAEGLAVLDARVRVARTLLGYEPNSFLLNYLAINRCLRTRPTNGRAIMTQESNLKTYASKPNLTITTCIVITVYKIQPAHSSKLYDLNK